jgi:ABC-type Na+ efflux pump permease subunit
MYEAIASIAIMIATIIVMILATARLFRVELLMQGKRFSAKEIIRIVVKGK